MIELLTQLPTLVKQAKRQPDQHLVTRITQDGIVWKIIIQHTPTGVDIKIKTRGKTNNGTEN